MRICHRENPGCNDDCGEKHTLDDQLQCISIAIALHSNVRSLVYQYITGGHKMCSPT